SQMMREIATPTMLHDGSGWGALAGMTAAVMAEAGFTGAPAVTVEAVEAAAFWQDLGQDWQVLKQYIKPYPTCRWAHAAVDAARELCEAHGLTADDVVEVRIRSFDYALELWPGMPDTTSKAQYALPFPVAVMIVHGRIGLEHVSGAGLSDGEVARLVARTKLIRAPHLQARYPEGRWAEVELVLGDGRVVGSGEVHARGGPERPFSESDIVGKYMEFAAPVLGLMRAAGLRDAVLGLAEGKPFSEVARFLYDPV
ncbi:MAG: MmgE/PrpD family protein, partial [Pseudooceanicola sp.]|nr:MmgE/PrpD family protein [Pseudooceanicola sp.]